MVLITLSTTAEPLCLQQHAEYVNSAYFRYFQSLFEGVFSFPPCEGSSSALGTCALSCCVKPSRSLRINSPFAFSQFHPCSFHLFLIFLISAGSPAGIAPIPHQSPRPGRFSLGPTWEFYCLNQDIPPRFFFHKVSSLVPTMVWPQTAEFTNPPELPTRLSTIKTVTNAA